MSSMEKLKQLDLETRKNLKEGKGPADECLCSTFAPLYSEDTHKNHFVGNVRESIRKAIRTVSGNAKRRSAPHHGSNTVIIPLTTTPGKKGGITTTKETIKRKSTCRKCGCANKDFVVKHSYATIQIISPDLASICPCPSDCMPVKAKQLTDNIQVTIERVDTGQPGFSDEKERESVGEERQSVGEEIETPSEERSEDGLEINGSGSKDDKENNI